MRLANMQRHAIMFKSVWCSPGETLDPWIPEEHTGKTLTKLRSGCADRSEFLQGTYVQRYICSLLDLDAVGAFSSLL